MTSLLCCRLIIQFHSHKVENFGEKHGFACFFLILVVLGFCPDQRKAMSAVCHTASQLLKSWFAVLH